MGRRLDCPNRQMDLKSECERATGRGVKGRREGGRVERRKGVRKGRRAGRAEAGKREEAPFTALV